MPETSFDEWFSHLDSDHNGVISSKELINVLGDSSVQDGMILVLSKVLLFSNNSVFELIYQMMRSFLSQDPNWPTVSIMQGVTSEFDLTDKLEVLLLDHLFIKSRTTGLKVKENIPVFLISYMILC